MNSPKRSPRHSTRHSLVAAALLVSGSLLGGCGEPPQPVASGAPPAALPPGHPPTAAQGQAAPQAPIGTATRLAGTVALDGAKFDLPEATVFVSVRPKGMRAPWLSRKYPVKALPKSESGARSLAFELDSSDTQGITFNSSPGHLSPPEGTELEVCVQLKEGGFVDTKTLAETLAAFEANKTDYALTLSAP